MKRSLVFLLMVVTLGVAYSQKKEKDKKAKATTEATKTETKVDPKTATPTTPETATQPAEQDQQIDPMLNLFLMKFNAAMRFNDQDIAKGALYDLIVENPGNDSLFLDLAMMYYEAQNYPSTILVSQELLARNKNNPTALEMAATSFEALNIYDKALQNYEALYLQTDAFLALYKMAFLQYNLKRYTECSATSDILLTKKEADEMKVTFTTADNQNKDYPIRVSVLNLKGMVAKDSGDKVNAKKFFEQALTLAPDFVQAKNGLASLK